MSIIKVISGGQTGADQGGLRAAKALGIATGGYVPRGCRTDDGPSPWLVSDFGCVEHRESQYAVRTIANVRMADATVWFGDETSPGGKVTCGTCEVDDRAHVKLHYPASVEDEARFIAALRLWLHDDVWGPKVLNVAGNRERSNPGIGAFVERVLTAALKP